MLNTKSSVKWSSLGKYFSENTEYRQKARQLIFDEIGFKPHLKTYFYPEI